MAGFGWFLWLSQHDAKVSAEAHVAALKIEVGRRDSVIDSIGKKVAGLKVRVVRLVDTVKVVDRRDGPTIDSLLGKVRTHLDSVQMGQLDSVVSLFNGRLAARDTVIAQMQNTINLMGAQIAQQDTLLRVQRDIQKTIEKLRPSTASKVVKAVGTAVVIGFLWGHK